MDKKQNNKNNKIINNAKHCKVYINDLNRAIKYGPDIFEEVVMLDNGEFLINRLNELIEYVDLLESEIIDMDKYKVENAKSDLRNLYSLLNPKPSISANSILTILEYIRTIESENSELKDTLEMVKTHLKDKINYLEKEELPFSEGNRIENQIYILEELQDRLYNMLGIKEEEE